MALKIKPALVGAKSSRQAFLFAGSSIASFCAHPMRPDSAYRLYMTLLTWPFWKEESLSPCGYVADASPLLSRVDRVCSYHAVHFSPDYCLSVHTSPVRSGQEAFTPCD